MTQETYLFVYGTLRRGFSSPVYERIASQIEWVDYSRIRGELYDIGDYPGALPVDTNNYIVGEIIKLKEPIVILEILDNYEGYHPDSKMQSEYYRKKESFELNNGSRVEAWMYWYNYPVKNKQRITNNDYLKYLQNNQSA